MTKFIKAKLKISDNLIDKCRVAAKITEFHIVLKLKNYLWLRISIAMTVNSLSFAALLFVLTIS